MTGEFDLIERYFAPLVGDGGATYGLKNDAAILPCDADRALVVTVDSLAADVHFRSEDPPELVAKKCLRVNLSDLAAMGAKPLGYLLALALPKGHCEDWVRRFAAGLAEDQVLYGITLFGGDTVATVGPPLITVTAFGTTPPGRALERATARDGDLIYLSGSLGDAALGLCVFRAEAPTIEESAAACLRERYLLPQPRVELGGRLLNEGLAHAAMDVSDGLVADLGHIAKASGLGAEISIANLPLSAAAASVLELAPTLGSLVLGGGDDYELLFTAAPNRADEVAQLARELDLPLTCIGRMISGQGVRVLSSEGKEIELDSTGWNHIT